MNPVININGKKTGYSADLVDAFAEAFAVNENDPFVTVITDTAHTPQQWNQLHADIVASFASIVNVVKMAQFALELSEDCFTGQSFADNATNKPINARGDETGTVWTMRAGVIIGLVVSLAAAMERPVSELTEANVAAFHADLVATYRAGVKSNSATAVFNRDIVSATLAKVSPVDGATVAIRRGKVWAWSTAARGPVPAAKVA